MRRKLFSFEPLKGEEEQEEQAFELAPTSEIIYVEEFPAGPDGKPIRYSEDIGHLSVGYFKHIHELYGRKWILIGEGSGSVGEEISFEEIVHAHSWRGPRYYSPLEAERKQDTNLGLIIVREDGTKWTMTGNTLTLVVREIREIFARMAQKLGLDPTFDLNFIDDTPIIGEHVFGEAFPDENRVWLEVAPEATDEEIQRTICHELIHLKYPEMDHDSAEFEVEVRKLTVGLDEDVMDTVIDRKWEEHRSRYDKVRAKWQELYFAQPAMVEILAELKEQLGSLPIQIDVWSNLSMASELASDMVSGKHTWEEIVAIMESFIDRRDQRPTPHRITLLHSRTPTDAEKEMLDMIGLGTTSPTATILDDYDIWQYVENLKKWNMPDSKMARLYKEFGQYYEWPTEDYAEFYCKEQEFPEVINVHQLTGTWRSKMLAYAECWKCGKTYTYEEIYDILKGRKGQQSLFGR